MNEVPVRGGGVGESSSSKTLCNMIRICFYEVIWNHFHRSDMIHSAQMVLSSEDTQAILQLLPLMTFLSHDFVLQGTFLERIDVQKRRIITTENYRTSASTPLWKCIKSVDRYFDRQC